MTNRVDGQSRRHAVRIDGSSWSRSALRWSATQARLVGVHARPFPRWTIAAWQDSMMTGYADGVPVLNEANANAASAGTTPGETEVGFESHALVPGRRSGTGAPS